MRSLICFVHIKKTAGKTIKHIMRRELGLGHCDVKGWRRKTHCFNAVDLPRLRRVYPWLRSIAGHSVKPYSDLAQAVPTLKYYTFLREPLRRTVSQYQYEIQMGRIPKDSFEEWIHNPRHHDLQVRTLAGRADLSCALKILEKDMAFVGLMEFLPESLSLMKTALDLPASFDTSLARVNAARDHSIRDSILNETRYLSLLQAANQLDLQLYEYARDVIFERQRTELGNSGDHQPHRIPHANDIRQYSARFYLNVAYRFLVYKPVVWSYRTAFKD